MKKFLSLLFALTCCVALVSCAHQCEFSADWSTDADAHWHVCVDEECVEIADKADHTWDAGTVTTAATQEADGVKTFACTVCGLTRTEPVAFTGMTEAEWNTALDLANFENFAYKETAVTSGSGVSVATESAYKFTKDVIFVKMTVAEQEQEAYITDPELVSVSQKNVVDSILALTPYANYRYDAETKTYKATEPLLIASIGASTDDITLTFENGKLIRLDYAIAFEMNNISFTATATVTLSDYGAVVLTPPTSNL